MNASIATYRNVFAVIVTLDDYDDDIHIQTQHATYKEIQRWVKQHYGIHVCNLHISQAKERYGLAKVNYRKPRNPEGHYIPKLTPEKEAAILAAFRWFGLIEQ